MRLACVVLLVSTSVAGAESFVDLAATDDGGAWVLVDRTEAIKVGPGYSEAGPRRVELRRIDRDGRGSAETTGRDEPLEAIAVARDELWAVTDRAVLRRDRAGWHALDIPAATARTGESQQANYAIVPLDPDRALVARGCPGRTPAGQSYPLPCTELFVVALDAQRVEPAIEIDARVEQATGDGRDAWLVVARNDRSVTNARLAVLHLAGDAWTAWTRDGQPLAGMRDGGTLAFEPRALAATPDGVFAADTHGVHRLGDDGAGPAVAIARDGGRWDATVGLVAHDHGVAVVTTPRAFGLDDDLDCTPSVRTPTRVEDVPTPRWWRRSPACPLAAQADAAGGRVWIRSRDALFYRDGERWHTIEAAGDHDVDLPIRVAISAPVALGYAHAAGSGFAIGLRPELVISRDIAHPRFGIGPFAELARGAGDTYVGGGITAVRYGPRFGVAGSLGLDGVYAGDSWHGQVVASAFVGFRRHVDRDLPLDAPIGVRVDVRPATAELPTAVSASLSFDTASLGVAIAMLAGHARGD